MRFSESTQQPAPWSSADALEGVIPEVVQHVFAPRFVRASPPQACSARRSTRTVRAVRTGLGKPNFRLRVVWSPAFAMNQPRRRLTQRFLL
jgi:hypothetical protein